MNTRFSRIVVLTGAGVSQESGIKTFRDSNGLWENHSIEEVATPEAFTRNPDLVHKFYNLRRRQLSEARPNKAHLSLAEFEESFEGDFTLITQNVDDLHFRAGSKNLIHMHGELKKTLCANCKNLKEEEGDLAVDLICQACQEVGFLRPHIVWFGEMPLRMGEIEKKLKNCDLFVSIGTSNQVYPAAGFSRLAFSYGSRCVELNLEETLGSDNFHESIFGVASKVVPEFFRNLL